VTKATEIFLFQYFLCALLILVQLISLIEMPQGMRLLIENLPVYYNLRRQNIQHINREKNSIILRSSITHVVGLQPEKHKDHESFPE